MSKPIVVVGSLNADLVTRLQRFPAPGETLTALDFQKFSGGKGANQAYAAGRLGGTVHMVGRVGNDGYGGWLVEQLQGGGVDTSHVGCDDSAATGMAFINLDASGQNQIVIVGGANAAVSPDDLAACGRPVCGRRLRAPAAGNPHARRGGRRANGQDERRRGDSGSGPGGRAARRVAAAGGLADPQPNRVGDAGAVTPIGFDGRGGNRPPRARAATPRGQAGHRQARQGRRVVD